MPKLCWLTRVVVAPLPIAVELVKPAVVPLPIAVALVALAVDKVPIAIDRARTKPALPIAVARVRKLCCWNPMRSRSRRSKC